MSTHMYYPQLRWKTAEQEALANTKNSTILSMQPIIKIPDIDWDFINNRYKKNLQTYLSDFGVKLATSWNSNTPIFLDVSKLDVHANQLVHPLDICISSANQHNKLIIPIYSPDYSANYLLSVIRNRTNGVAIRLTSGNIKFLQQTLSSINLSPSYLDVILDLEGMAQYTPQYITYIEQCINYIKNFGKFRTIIISSTCYPQYQSGIPQHIAYKTPRYEWLIWSDLIKNNNIDRTPGFSDYPVSPANVDNLDPRIIDPYVSVRYSDESDWIFVKGTAAKGNGWGQTQHLCQILIADPCYKGPLYSWGDNHINSRANGMVTSGTAKDWRKVANNHHFELVAQQLLNFSNLYPVKP